MPNSGTYTAADVDQPTGQFTAADVDQTTGAQPVRNVALRPGESIYRRYSTISPEATKEKIAENLPPVGATIGEMAGGPLGSAIGGGVGTLAEPLITGGKEDYGKAAENALLYGATSYGLQKVGPMLGNAYDKVARFIGVGPKSAPELWQAANEAVGASKRAISLPTGATGPEQAYVNPGQTLVERAGLDPKQLAKMTPFEQAQTIGPHWRAAGAEVDAIADTATKNGVTLDAGKSLTQALKNVDSPQIQQRMTDIMADTGQQLGIQDWRKATPNEMLELRRATWDNLGKTKYGPSLYGALTRDLKDAVPQMVPADQAYSGYMGAMDSINDKQAASMVKSEPSGLAKVWASLPAPIRQYLPGAATTGGFLEGYRKLFGNR